MTEPKERPLLFSAPMILALLSGQKTVTRRTVKLPFNRGRLTKDVWTAYDPNLREDRDEWMPQYCPYGWPGERLWVRETWALEDCGDDGERLVWAADREAAWRAKLTERFYLPSDHDPRPWRPSIFMPRWASRLTLEVVSVRVERLHDITEENANAEGVAVPDGQDFISARSLFAALWGKINGPGSWEANPWVWRVEFRRLP